MKNSLIIIKNIALYLLGALIMSGFFEIVKAFDPGLTNNFLGPFIGITWSTFVTIKCIQELEVIK